MKLHHLLALPLLALNFSGRPVAEAPKRTVPAVDISYTKPVEDNESIPWAEDRRLLWDDFQCKPQRQGDAVASTSTSLGIAYQIKNGVLTYHITCNFSKQKSWGVLKTDYILAHEQAHFDITELHARRLYQALKAYPFSATTYKQDIAAIYERIVAEKEAMQEEYDGQTDHSRKRRVQYDWLDRIDAMLLETEAFAKYP